MQSIAARTEGAFSSKKSPLSVDKGDFFVPKSNRTDTIKVKVSKSSVSALFKKLVFNL